MALSVFLPNFKFTACVWVCVCVCVNLKLGSYNNNTDSKLLIIISIADLLCLIRDISMRSFRRSFCTKFICCSTPSHRPSTSTRSITKNFPYLTISDKKRASKMWDCNAYIYTSSRDLYTEEIVDYAHTCTHDCIQYCHPTSFWTTHQPTFEQGFKDHAVIIHLIESVQFKLITW